MIDEVIFLTADGLRSEPVPMTVIGATIVRAVLPRCTFDINADPFRPLAKLQARRYEIEDIIVDLDTRENPTRTCIYREVVKSVPLEEPPTPPSIPTLWARIKAVFRP